MASLTPLSDSMSTQYPPLGEMPANKGSGTADIFDLDLPELPAGFETGTPGLQPSGKGTFPNVDGDRALFDLLNPPGADPLRPTGTGASSTIASAKSNPSWLDAMRTAINVAAPDALVLGGSGPALGQFGLYGFESGTWTSFTAIPSKIPRVSTVGTVNTSDLTNAEGGLGLSRKIMTPIGEVLIFINGRTNDFDLTGSDGPTTFSINLGAALSVSDAAMMGMITGLTSGSGFLGGRIAAAAIPYDAWIGAAWRGTMTVEDGKITGLTISGEEIPVDQLSRFISDRLGPMQRAAQNAR